MEPLTCFADDRNKTWCIHCGGALELPKTNRDHVPTKKLLRAPYPNNLPVVEICTVCNDSFSLDEQYTVAFLSAVLSGSVDPQAQIHPAAAGILLKNEKLRLRIDKARTTFRTISGETQHRWVPERERTDSVIVKNARGHAFYELGEPLLSPPDSVWSCPLVALTPTERAEFEGEESGAAFWPEVGSRMLQRVVTGLDLDGPWVVVQDDVYRYSVVQDGGIRVRSVIFEYLATEVRWEA